MDTLAGIGRHLKTTIVGVLVAAALALVPTAEAKAVSVPAASAASFVDSIGVNVHLNFTDTAYGQFEKVRAALDGLGVHYVRDGIAYGNKTQFGKLRTLYGDGIRVDAIIGDPQQRWGTGPLPVQLNAYEHELGPALASIEGPNEYDIQGDPNWIATLRSYQQQLWEEVRRRPALAAVPVLGPSLVQRASRAALGDISAWATEGNMHPYPGGEQPDADAHMNSELSLASLNTGTKPVQATETGYTNAVNELVGQLPASERAAGVYEPRIFLDNFRRGITRTYAYELIDENEDSSRSDAEDAFGLLRNNFTEKPAYTSLKNLIALVADSGSEAPAGSLSYTLAGAPSSTRTVLLEKSDGSFYLAIWNAISVWNQDTRTELRPADATATLNLEQPVSSVQVFRLGGTTVPVAAYGAASSIQVPVGAEVTLVRVAPPAASASPAAARRTVRLRLDRHRVAAGGRLGIHGVAPTAPAGLGVSIQSLHHGWHTLGHTVTHTGGKFSSSVRIPRHFSGRSRLRVIVPQFEASRSVRFQIGPPAARSRALEDARRVDGRGPGRRH